MMIKPSLQSSLPPSKVPRMGPVICLLYLQSRKIQATSNPNHLSFIHTLNGEQPELHLSSSSETYDGTDHDHSSLRNVIYFIHISKKNFWDITVNGKA